MKDLKCALRECRYNQSYSCMAHEITVTKEAVCQSFTPTDKAPGDRLFEFGAEAARPRFSVDTCVNCTAPCLFQKNSKCVAVGITVLGDGALADCATYINR